MKFSVVVAMALLPAVAFAQTPPLVTYPPGDDKIVVIHKGDAAPFAGQLYDDATAVRWASWLEQYKGRYALDLKQVEDTCTVAQEHAAQLDKITADRDAAVNADLTKRLQESETARLKAENELRNPSFFDRPGVWFGVGVFTTVLMSVSTAYLVHAAAK